MKLIALMVGTAKQATINAYSVRVAPRSPRRVRRLPPSWLSRARLSPLPVTPEVEGPELSEADFIQFGSAGRPTHRIGQKTYFCVLPLECAPQTRR